MSYNTNYCLQFGVHQGDDPECIYDELRDHINRFDVDADLGDLVEGLTVITTWHEHEPDMLDLSRKYPGAYFILSGIGSEHFDMWRKMFINGDVEEIRPNLVWPEFKLLDNVIEGGEL